MDNTQKPITWDVIAEKLDNELQNIRSYTSPDTDSNLLSYFRGAAAYIHRRLREHGIPADLYEAVCRRDKILGEIAHFWMDEAGRRGGDTRDKEGVAAISVNNWLEQVRQEERENALKGLKLDEVALIYSEVTLDADGETTSYWVGGAPDTHNIWGWEQYRDFTAGLPADTAISVTVNTWSVGNGESENASDEDAELIEANWEYLDKLYGIDPIQTAEFTEYVPDESLDYDDEEPDEGMEP